MNLVEAPPTTMSDRATEVEPPRPLRHLSDAELEDRLARQAGRIAATQASFVAHVRELDLRVEGIGYQGARSAPQWLSWRLGIGLGTAREQVRVARALGQLPRIAAAFAAGQLSYCKVRAVTRVATPANEAELLEVALGCTGSQLERTVRVYKRTGVTECAASATLRRRVSRRVTGDGSVVFTIQVPPDDAAVMDKAWDAALRVVLDDDGQPIEVPEETRLARELGAEAPIVRAQADAFVLIAESFVANGLVGQRGDGMEVLVHADLRDLVDLVCDGSAPDQPSDDDPLADDPLADDPIADYPPAEDSLVDYPLAQDPLATDSPAEHPEVDDPPDEHPGDAPPAPDSTRAWPAPPSPRPSRPTWTRSVDGQPLLSATALRRLCETSVRLMAHAPDGRPIDLGRTTRDASPRQRRVLHERDKHCRFPGCTQRRRLIPHHVIWWSRGGPTDMDNLVLLCPAHHRAVHEVGYQVVAHGHGRFSFYNPVGRPLDVTGRIEDPSEDQLGWPSIPWQPAPMPEWGGERLHLAYLVDGLIANDFASAA
jgi:hypothetical protein